MLNSELSTTSYVHNDEGQNREIKSIIIIITIIIIIIILDL